MTVSVSVTAMHIMSCQDMTLVDRAHNEVQRRRKRVRKTGTVECITFASATQDCQLCECRAVLVHVQSGVKQIIHVQQNTNYKKTHL